MKPKSLVLIMMLVCLTVGGRNAWADPAEPVAGGEIVTGQLTNAAGTRAFQTYTPPDVGPGKPLIVWLHGASEYPEGDSRELQRSGSLLAEADRLGFSVVAPMQSLEVEPNGTWQILDPANLVRDRGESSIVADIVRRSIEELHADPARVYIAGHSAGGGLTQDVAALYPELFAGVAVVAGFPFAADPTGTALRVARHDEPMPTFFVQGDRDRLALPLLGDMSLSAALRANGIADTPASSSTVPASESDRYSTDVRHYGHDRTEVVYALVRGADHPTGPGGITVNGPALDRQLIEFLLSKHR